MNQISISKLKSIDGYRVEWSNGNEYILSRRNSLFISKSLDNTSNFKYLTSL